MGTGGLYMRGEGTDTEPDHGGLKYKENRRNRPDAGIPGNAKRIGAPYDCLMALCEAAELQSFSASVISIIDLNYKESGRKDKNGNWFRYRAKVRDTSGAQAGRWVWDVFLQKPD